MAMAEPKIESIMAALLARLQRITTGNGYLLTLNVSRIKNSNTPALLAAVMYQEDSDIPSPPTNEFQRQEDISVAVFTNPAEGDTTSIDTYANRACACLHYALYRDAGGSFEPTLGGLIRRIDVLPPSPYQLLSIGTPGVTFRFRIQYTHALDAM